MTPPGADPTEGPPEQEGVVLEGTAVLFGYEPVSVRASVHPRTRAWRVGGAARAVGASVLVAPFVALFPPHAIWPIGALATGAVFARRRWKEQFTLLGLVGDCPKCGEALSVKRGRLRIPHPLPCEGCHHESSLRLDPGMLEEAAVS